MTRSKAVQGILGPAIKNDNVDLNLPECVQFKTDKDVEEFKAFVASVIKAANENALDQLAEFVTQQNNAMTQLVKKLGAS